MTGGLELSGRITFILIVLIFNITFILSLELDTHFLPRPPTEMCNIMHCIMSRPVVTDISYGEREWPEDFIVFVMGQ